MVKYTGPSVPDNAVMIETGSRGRIVPDRYATGDASEKYQDHHAKLIHGDIQEWYGQDTEPTEPW
jgi:hypothetical protein